MVHTESHAVVAPSKIKETDLSAHLRSRICNHRTCARVFLFSVAYAWVLTPQRAQKLEQLPPSLPNRTFLTYSLPAKPHISFSLLSKKVQMVRFCLENIFSWIIQSAQLLSKRKRSTKFESDKFHIKKFQKWIYAIPIATCTRVFSSRIESSTR